MEQIRFLIDFILHIDEHLNSIISQYGLWTYAILFGIIFVETGLVVMVPPFVLQGERIKVNTDSGEYIERM